ncbi:hypothetical protein M2448_000156 [Dysgonomonas sp. PF1-14]|uniref:hypothetical protein n=2 Tax=Dysgonomonas TaxID=156973 RepID=UPI00247690BE|nr:MULTISPECIES: hypothetical protein [unclassified Dysgonomonas]MDH6307238.1 hypothetical protein [Dysgonomonas sp. PF1-14]MDH6337156.1 hypothetical protein [Dysgonomonas sp. PF1-16]MDH6396283.1 hypothetical protein [Dysgonomonas sp. PF1-23]
MKKYIFILLILPFLLAANCNGEDSEDCHLRVTIVNNWDKDISIYRSFLYPDSLGIIGDAIIDRDIEANSTKKVRFEYIDCLETTINYQNKDGIMMVYFYDKEVIDSYPRDTIIKYRMYLKKMDLTVDDLQNSDWTLTYP